MLNLATKGDFAKLVNVSPGRVSQMIAEGKIADCLVGEGREQRIDVDKAIEKLKIRTDPGQRMGNGAATRLDIVPHAAPVAQPPTVADDLDIRLKKERLAQAEAQNRKLREEEKARVGTSVAAEHVRAETAKLAGTILQMFERGLAGIAAEIAATYKLPQRDVVHLVRKQFRDVRTDVSKKLAADALNVPATFEDTDTE